MRRNERLEQLTEHYLDLFGLAMSIVRDSDDAKDALQEAIAETMARFGHLRNPYAYCVKSLKNNCIDVLRRRQKMTQINNLDNLMSEPLHDLAAEVWKAKEKLPKNVRALVELHDIEGYSMTELAVLTGVSLSTVKRLIAKAHNQIRNELIN